MKPPSASEHDARDREVIELLKSLGAFESNYPTHLLAARRAAILAYADELRAGDAADEWSAEDEELVQFLGNLKPTQAVYPSDLLAARRAALIEQVERAGGTSFLDQVQGFARRIFHYRTPGFMRISLALAGLLAAVLLGSLVFSRTGEPLTPAPSQIAAEPTQLLLTGTGEAAITICEPEDQSSSCLPGRLDRSLDLANPANGTARPAVSKDARSYRDEVYRAAYVNDGRGGASWVSNSPDSWIKIDLGAVSTINTVSLRKGSAASPYDGAPGQFVIAVALSDVYADGDSRDDDVEYTQVFQSEPVSFSGAVSQTETLQIYFPAVRARFVKITFEQAGTAIEEIGVFMVEPEPTSEPEDTQPAITLTAIRTATPLPIDTATSAATVTRGPTHTVVPGSTSTPASSATLPPSDTPPALPTNTQPPAETSTPVPTVPLPFDTPLPLPTAAPPTPVPPTTAQPSPVSTAPIVVTGNNQSLTFSCNGNAVEIRGHANTITLLGSCSSITVTGNGNEVFWQYGSPVITDRGTNNIIEQL